MRKYLFTSCLFISFYLLSYSQTQEEIDNLHSKMDSLKKVVPRLNGIAKVDGLNRIVDIYEILDEDNQMQVDSATPYAKLSLHEAKKIGYKRGLGYANLKMSYCEWRRNGIYLEKNNKNDPAILASLEEMLKQSIQIGEELGDNVMIGSAYSLSAWTEEHKGNIEKAISFNKKAIASIEKALKTSQGDGYKEMEFTFCADCNIIELRIAWLYNQMIILQKDNKENEQYFNLGISHYEKAGANSDMMGDAYTWYARAVGVNTNAETAIEYFKKAIPHFQLSGNKQRELNATTMICASYYALGDFENGLEYSKRSVQLVEKIVAGKTGTNLKNNEYGKAYYWMGRIYSTAGDHEGALTFMRKAHGYYEDNPGTMNSWAAAIGEMYRLKGDYDSAMHYLVRFANSPGTHLGKLYLGRLYISIAQYDKALPLINEMIIADTRDNNMGNLGGDYTDAGKIWLGKKDYQKALSNARTGLTLISKTKRNLRLIDNYQVLSEIFNKLEKNDSAYFYLKQYTMVKDSFLNRQFFIRLNDYKKQADEERKTSRINLLNKNNQLKEQKLKQEATIKKSLIAGLILLMLLAIFIFRTLTLKRKSELQKQQLENEKKQAELQQRATELKMQALRAQMNPHFIFNCLSSINRFIFKNDNKLASDYLTRFSRLIRMVLMNSSKKLITLEDELEMLRLYLDLERLRFKDAFDYSITTTNIVDAGAIFIPPLLLQPFCENAVWHGLMHKESKGHLNVIISEVINEHEKVLHCVIEDDGVGGEKAAEMKSKSAESEKSLGLKITTERLALLNQENNFSTFYKIEDILNENNEVAGTRVQLKIMHKENIEELV